MNKTNNACNESRNSTGVLNLVFNILGNASRVSTFCL